MYIIIYVFINSRRSVIRNWEHVIMCIWQIIVSANERRPSIHASVMKRQINLENNARTLNQHTNLKVRYTDLPRSDLATVEPQTPSTLSSAEPEGGRSPNRRSLASSPTGSTDDPWSLTNPLFIPHLSPHTITFSFRDVNTSQRHDLPPEQRLQLKFFYVYIIYFRAILCK